MYVYANGGQIEEELLEYSRRKTGRRRL
jgi:hypothetical protein